MIVISGLRGILNISIELANRMRQQGYKISFVSSADLPKDLEYHGHNCYKIPRNNKNPASSIDQGNNKIGRLVKRYANIKSNQRKCIEALNLEEYKSILERIKPDLVILDIEMHDQVLATFEKRIPFLLLSCWFSIWPSDQMPHPASKLIPDNKNNDMIISEWTKIKQLRHDRQRHASIRSGFTTKRDILLAYANNIGFSADYFSLDHWPSSMTFQGLPTLIANSKHLEFPYGNKENLHYIGLVINNNRPKTTNEQEILEIIKEAKSQGKKIVYLTVTTMDDEADNFYLKVLEAIKSDESIFLICGTNLGDKTYPNSYFASDLPQTTILQHSDLCINHAGINTMNECIYHAVPMLIYSGGNHDQNGCAARAEYHDISPTKDRQSTTVASIKNDIDSILSSNKYKSKILTIKQEIINAKEEEQLFSIIEETIKTPAH